MALTKLPTAAFSSGSVGTAQLADGAVTTEKLIANVDFRNRLINGDMSIAQRGTSSSSNGYVSLDRWYVNQSGGSTTFSQETNSNPSETGGLQKYARLNVSSSSDYTGIRQFIEDVTSVPAGPITISFYAKGTAPTGGLYVAASQHFGSGGSADVDVSTQITSSLTGSWVRYSAQLTLPSIDGKTIGASNYLAIIVGQWSNSSSTAYDLNITGVQAEVGSSASDFEFLPYDINLLRCQRYYEICEGGKQFYLSATHNPKMPVMFSVKKRANPTLTKITGAENCASSVGVTAAAIDQTLGAQVIGNNAFATGADKYLYAKFSADAEL